MLAKQANTNGYRWVQKHTHHGNYVVPTCIVVTCLILPRMGSSATNFSRGSQKAIKKEMDKTRKINIPLSAFDIQILKSSKNWYLKYNISQDEVEKILIGKPCYISTISKDDDKHCVEVSLYTIKEYKNL